MNNSLCFPHIIETHLVDHCNLNCAGCSHFSPLVKREVFRDLEDFKRDLTGLAGIFRDIYELRLMGGEPLLHPGINEFISVSREIFPETNLVILTNGVLLPQMPAEFWQTCARCRVRINISRYPIRLDIQPILKTARSFGVRVKSPKMIESFFQFVNIKGDSDPQQSFANCRAMYTTLFLRDMRLYTCSFAPHVSIFNDHFGENIPVSEGDSIGLQEGVAAGDIYNFINKPIPLCRWCKTKRPIIRWQRTKLTSIEWTGGEVNDSRYIFEINKYRTISTFHTLQRELVMLNRRKK